MTRQLPSHRYAVLIVAAALAAAPCASQTASRVRDINTDGPTLGSYFGEITAAGSRLFFIRDSKELWASGGTPETTRMVRDFCAGDCDGQASIAGSFGGLALVTVEVGFFDKERLWRSDGTPEGTFPLSTSVILQQPVAAGGVLYLTGRHDDGIGSDLWRTDGSQAGTTKVDLGAEGAGVSIIEKTAVGSRLYFSGFAGLNHCTLWSTDGTTAGSQQLGTLGRALPNTLTAAGGRLFFFAGGALWTSDGTPAGTRSLRQFASLPALGRMQPLGGKVYFAATDSLLGSELWVSDGTAAGTRRVTDFGVAGASILQIQAAGDRIVFLASDGDRPLQIWSTAGSLESTLSVPNPPCPECGFVFSTTQLMPFGGRVFFFGSDGGHGYEPWTSDGTAAGTHLLADVWPGKHGSLENFSGRFVATPLGLNFVAEDPAHGTELWRTDGSSAGTVRLTDFATPQGFFTSLGAVIGSKLYFQFGDSSQGSALWVSEPPGSVRRVAVIAPRGPSSDPRALTPFHGSLLFVAQDSVSDLGAQLWRTDGTDGGTVPLGAPMHEFGPYRFAEAAGFLFFLSENSHGERTLWRTDGSAAGTLPLLLHVQPGIAAYRGKLYCWGFDGSGRAAIWTSDGTGAGTSQIFVLPAEIGSLTGMTAIGQDLYLASSDTLEDAEIWHSDGTLAGTQKIATFTNYSFDDGFSPAFFQLGGRTLFSVGTPWTTDGTAAGTAPLLPLDTDAGRGTFDMTILGNSAYFVAQTNALKNGLWRTDGTPGGTVLIKEIAIYHRSFSVRPTPLLVAGAGRLWLIADDGIHGQEVWTSDGTSAGTTLLRDLNPGPAGSRPGALKVVGDRLFFSATDGLHGIELWESDGTAAGTRLVQDIAPFDASSLPSELAVLGDRLYFAADDGPTGNELWTLPLSGGSGCIPGDTALCLGGRYRVEARWRDFEGHAGPGHAVSLTADTGTFWFFAPSNVEAIVKVLDGTGVNGHAWVFYGALSSVEYTLTVTDTQTGLTRQYFNPAGQLGSLGDTQGFGPLGAKRGSPPPPPTIAAPSLPAQVVERRSAAAKASCVAGARTLCLAGGRFAVEVAWTDFQDHSGSGTARPISGDTGAFWFFNDANIELVVKVLDGRAANGRYWLFYGALSNVGYTLTVTDTEAGTVRTYLNPRGRFASVADTQAF